MFQLPKLCCTLVSLIVFLGLATPVLAGPTPTPTTPTPTTPTPTTPTPATPTPDTTCTAQWPIATIFTLGKGQSPTNNNKVRHSITGNIIDPGSLGPTAHRIPVCAGSFVRSVITASSGFATMNTALGSLDCTSTIRVCQGNVNVAEKYTAVNRDSTDVDRITFLPR
jgi:hypothetical protein